MATPSRETFGYRLATHRVERGMTEAQLAEELNKAPVREEITQKDVRSWERMEAVPNEETLQNLCDILIEENPAIDPHMKSKARNNLIEAAHALRDALESGTVDAIMSPGAVTFGNLVNHHRKRMNLTEKKLADAINGDAPHETITAQHVLDYQFGHALPGLRVMRHAADVFELDATQREEFYQAHAHSRVEVDCTEFDARRDALHKAFGKLGLSLNSLRHLPYKRPSENLFEKSEARLIERRVIADTPENDTTEQQAKRAEWNQFVEGLRELQQDYKAAVQRAGGTVDRRSLSM
jgi:transcriptional regulator with XRE-family HTH domain